jgi:hypothetical protein
MAYCLPACRSCFSIVRGRAYFIPASPVISTRVVHGWELYMRVNVYFDHSELEVYHGVMGFDFAGATAVFNGSLGPSF